MILELCDDGGRSLHGGRPPSSQGPLGDHGGVPASPSAPSPRPGDDAGAVLPQPRQAPDDEVVVRPAVGAVPPPARSARVYADGSALSRYLHGAPCRAQWLAWASTHEGELITTPLGLTELRRIARPHGVEASGIARDVEDRVEVVRFSDQTLRAATKVSGVLSPFLALHLGVALAHPGIRCVATYDVQLAQVAALHGLTVVSPGWPPDWWERAG